MSALFSKTKKDKEKKKEESRIAEMKENTVGELQEKTEPTEQAGVGSAAFSGTGGEGTHRVLRGFYISEKSSLGNTVNQYTFKVSERANKSEIKKEVSKLFKVEVKNVKILNMPRKRRDFGKHPGFKTGFKKAIVVLKDGFTIGQAKP